MLDKLIEQWLTNTHQLGDPVLRFVENGGTPPTMEQLKRAAANPIIRTYLQKGLEIFERLTQGSEQAAAAAGIQVIRWRIETVLEAFEHLDAPAQQGQQTQQP